MENAQQSNPTENVQAVIAEPTVGGGLQRQLSQMERAEVEIAIATAKRYPRTVSKSVEEMNALACRDVETAEGCFYGVPRDGKTIEGPSVRLAEIAVSCWGNIAVQAEVVGEDAKFVYAIGSCRDLEKNVMVRMQGRRRITTKNGHRFKDDMIAITANAACAIVFRNAVFKVIPGSIIHSVYMKARRVAIGDAMSFRSRLSEVMNRLQKMGAHQDRVLAGLNKRSMEDIDTEDVATLIGLGTAIKEGTTSVDEAFPEVREEKATDEKDGEAAKGDSIMEKVQADIVEMNAKADARESQEEKEAPPTPGKTRLF